MRKQHTDLSGAKGKFTARRNRLREYEKVVEGLEEMIVVVDRNYRYVLANRAFLKYRNMEREQLIGRKAREVLDPDVFDSVAKPKLDECFEGNVVRYELRYNYPHLGQRDLLITYFPIEGPGGIDRAACILQDITERKQAEHALRKAHEELARVTRIASLGELTASIAHEINQPLGAVVTNGSASLRWLDGNPPNLDEAREAMHRAVSEANRASEVIARIRALLQKTPPRMEQLDINKIVHEALILQEHELRRDGVIVDIELEHEAPAVLGDRVQLHQVMSNLIINAIEAMVTVSDRPRKMFIKSERQAHGVLIQIQDSGEGLDSEQLERIFQPFFTTKPQGIGMGLSISRSIIEAHGGHLWATSASPLGAIFQFTLPEDPH